MKPKRRDGATGQTVLATSTRTAGNAHSANSVVANLPNDNRFGEGQVGTDGGDLARCIAVP